MTKQPTTPSMKESLSRSRMAVGSSILARCSSALTRTRSRTEEYLERAVPGWSKAAA